MRGSLPILLVADGDTHFRGRLCNYLEQAGFLTQEAVDGRCLLAELQREIPHLIILDLQLPYARGAEICRRIKLHGDVPIVVITAIDDEETRISVLNLYVDDFIQKPTRFPEVAARVRSVLRRSWLSYLPTSTVRVDDRLSLDFLRREVRTPTGITHLTPMETRFLQLLIRNAGQVLPNELILERLWGNAHSSANVLWEYVRRVRRKIGDDAAEPRYIVNEPGLGYRYSGPTLANNGGDFR